MHRQPSENCLQLCEIIARLEKTVVPDYPKHQEVLKRLTVEQASLDMVCFADHAEERMFFALRGTDRMINHLTFPRDWGNNLRILFGIEPPRSAAVIADYKEVRLRYPRYRTYGCGHSLGGTVVLHLAKVVEEDEGLAFSRIDVFNTAVSPLTRNIASLTKTEFQAHRVPGDLASWGLRIDGVNVVPVKPHLSRHSLGHFLPPKAGELEVGSASKGEAQSSDALAESKEERSSIWSVLSALSCVGARQKAPPANDRRSLPRLSLADSTPPCASSQDDAAIPPEGLQRPSSSSSSAPKAEDARETNSTSNAMATNATADVETRDAGDRAVQPSSSDVPRPADDNPAKPNEATQEQQRIAVEEIARNLNAQWHQVRENCTGRHQQERIASDSAPDEADTRQEACENAAAETVDGAATAPLFSGNPVSTSAAA